MLLKALVLCFWNNDSLFLDITRKYKRTRGFYVPCKESGKSVKPDQLVLRHKLTLIYTVFKIRSIGGRSCEFYCGILLQFIFAIVKIL